MKISLAEIDDLTSALVFNSYLVLIILIIIIFFLILSNSQLFRYAFLFENLKEVDKLKDEFISIGSHELRAPLTVILGYSSIAKEELSQGKTTNFDKYLEAIEGSANRLNTLVGDMLEVSRIEQGRIKMTLVNVKLSDIVKEIIGQFTIPAKEKKLDLKLVEPTPEISSIEIIADVDRLKQVVINLLSNAIKYTLEGGVTVNLVFSDNKKNILIKVKDTGVGMNAKAREKLFQKFYRVENEKTKNIIGTGLGLWITKMLVELMKGEIYVDSMEGAGTEFTVSFPIVNK